MVYSLDKQAARLNEFLEKIGIIKTNVLACSMGGTVVTWAAKQEPVRYGKLLLIAPSLNHKISIIHPAMYSWVRHVMGGWFISPKVVRLIYSFVVAKPITPEKVEQYYRPFHQNRDTVGVFAQSLHLVADKRLPSELKVLQQPIKILYGQKDRIIPFRMYDDVKKVLPRLEFDFHPQAGHHVMEDDPAWVVKKAIAFLK